MEATRFDALVRILGKVDTRRHLIQGAVLAVAAAAGFGGGEQAAALRCRGRDATCRRDDQCCSGKCRANGRCAPAGIGDPCDPETPGDCRTGVCGCLNRDPAGRCTCRQEACLATGEGECANTNDCCTGFCLSRERRCFPPVQRRPPV
jgi:hypothetical protein